MRTPKTSSFVLLLSLLVGGTAVAQVSLPSSGAPVKPRVFVIFDTSTSMKQDPAYKTNGLLWETDDTTTDPDTSAPTDCRSKFCIAKDVVYDVLKTHTDEVRLGTASYFQYLIKYQASDTQQTKCWYDATFKPGFTLYYPRSTTTTTQYEGMTTVGQTTASTVALNGLTNGHHRYCAAASGAHAYNLTVSSANPTGSQSCSVYSYNEAPVSFSPPNGMAAACVNGQTYSSITTVLDPTVFTRTVGLGTMCPAQVDPMSITAATPVSLVVTESLNNVVGGTSVPRWNAFANLTTECRTGMPCNMFSSSAPAGTVIQSKQSMYGLFEGSCGGGPNAGDGLPYNCSNPGAAWPSASTPFKHASRIDSSVVPFTGHTTNQNACVGTLGVKARYTDNGNRSRFMSNGEYTAATTTGLPLPALSSNQTPTATCTSEWPCDTTLTAQTPVTQPPTVNVINNCPSMLGTGVTCVPAATPATIYQYLKPVAAACPSWATPQTSTPADSTQWNAAPVCSAGNGACNVVAAATATVGGTASCAANQFTWDGSTPANCTFKGRTFSYAQPSTPVVTNSTVVKTISPTSSCPANGSNAATAAVYGAAGDWSGATGDLTTCRGTGTCPLSGLVTGTSATLEYSAWSTTATSAPSGYAGAPAERDTGGTYDAPMPCTGYTNGNTYLEGGVLGKFIAGSGPGGATSTGFVGENEIFKCRFQRRERQWSRAKTSCTYTITKTKFITDNSITWCQYQVKNFTLTTPNPDRYDCTYSNVARRFDFAFDTARECTYYRLKSTGSRATFDFRYSYLTKGGELAGSASKTTLGDKTNPATSTYASFSADCPTTWDECLGAGTTCFLRDNANAPAWSSVNNTRNSGRTANLVGGGSINMTAATFPTITGMGAGTGGTGYACKTSGAAPAEPARSAYTVKQGSPPSPNPTYRLVSDWFSCSDPNDAATCTTNSVSDINSDPRTIPSGTLNPSLMAAAARDGITGPFDPITSADWTNAATKAFGASGAGTTYSTPSQMFVPFPADSDASGNLPQLKGLMSKCFMPTASNVSSMNWSGSGLCMSDLGAPNSLGVVAGSGKMLDYTPLFGSLENAKQYIKSTLATDSTFAGNNTTCRPYFVILATDGAENTPSDKANEVTNPGSPISTNLQSAVAGLRNISDGTRTVDTKTYVVGFGDAIADPANAAVLNSMALSGGTTAAFFASDRASLVSELNNVFSGILRGTYSRSKPVISTNGSSIYASQFDVDATTPEWKGKLYAYAVDPIDGSLTDRWELSAKLNAMTDGSRTIYTDVASATPVRQSFEDSNATAANALNNHWSYPVGLSTSRLIRFVRNASLAEEYNQATNPPRRESRLNAIVHSNPVAVGKSASPRWWGGSPSSNSYASYQTFQTNMETREERLLVGASDGLVRSIRDNTGNASVDGQEGWGWVPSSMHSYLHKSMAGYYAGMDGQISVADVCADDDANGDAADCGVSNWKTIAIAAARGGSRDMVALDVTDPTNPKFAWKHTAAAGGAGIAYTFSAPSVGRVRLTNKDIFLAFFGGGGREGGVGGPLSEDHADEVYFVNAVTGSTVKYFNAEGDMDDDDIWGEDNQFYARPSFWERAGSPYMDHAMFAGVNGRLYITRFREPLTISGGVVTADPVTDTDKWRPEVFFDPSDAANKFSPTGATVTVRRIFENTATTPITYTQAPATTPETLPLSRSLPIYVRPRLAPVYDTGELLPDYFVGTGDGFSPGSPRPEFTWNYFYAVHDDNRHNDGKHDGAPLWVNQFVDQHEQVISEPAMVVGSLIVATYLPPTTTSPCENAGDTILYCFNPVNGDLRDCLYDPVTNTSTSRRALLGAGIPSDLVSVGDSLYLTASNLTGRPVQQRVRPTTQFGEVRSWRRVR